MKVLFFGDIVGKTGRRAVAAALPRLKIEHKADLVIANGENAAHGLGITAKIAGELLSSGCDILTSGNHVFDKSDQANEVFARYPGRIIRPANFQGDYPGRGWTEITVAGHKVVVANFHAQVFMERQFRGLIGSPFAALDRFLQEAPKSAILLVDFHSEVTSEKRGFGLYADGKVAAVWGTHTHVQTADAQILPGGTAYISDVGMCGAANSILGMKKESALARFLGTGTGGLEVDEGDEAEIAYIVIDIDETTGRSRSILARLERITF